jgi:4-hydroxybenzoate polyprenyltransferase
MMMLSPRGRYVWAVVDLLRPFNVLGVWLGFGIGYELSGGAAGWGQVAGGLAILALVHSVATLENDLQDLAIDHTNGRRGALQEHRLTAEQARWLVYGLGAMALGLALRPGPRQMTQAGFAVAFLALSWAYNNRPLVLSRRPVASMVVMGLCYGALPLVYGYAVGGGRPSWWVGALGLAWWAQRVSLSILKDFKDAVGDRKFGKRTFYLRYGRRPTVAASWGLGLVAYTATLALLTGRLTRPATGTAALALVLVLGLAARDMWQRRALLHERQERRLNRLFHASLAAHNQFEGALLLCLIWSAV